MAKAVVAQHNKVFGGPPPLDFGTYTFIADYMPQISGDGMEHRNSTKISQPRSLKAADFSQLDTLRHEFIHAWNVERLRTAGLERFDYTQEIGRAEVGTPVTNANLVCRLLFENKHN